MIDRARLPHAILERESRLQKADKIAILLEAVRDLGSCQRLLEIGCGSGIIAARLAELVPHASVHAVDVADNRIAKTGYEFTEVQDTKLPFADGQFDLVISNHVIEHVGEHLQQIEHLQEISRVLAPDGVAYLAVPNKWRLVEPHYRLPFLSWLPKFAADYWVRKTGKASYYDCVPLSHRSALRLFAEAKVVPTDVTLAALRTTLDIEHAGSLAAGIAGRIPDFLLGLSKPIIPTLIFLLKKQNE